MIWGYSQCRSRFGLYRELCRLVPTRIAIWRTDSTTESLRQCQGHRHDEFSDVLTMRVGENLNITRRLLEETIGWLHIVAAYQVSPTMRRVVEVASSRGDMVVIASEAPWCRWRGWRRIAWRIYVQTLVRVRVRKVIRSARCLINLSGELDGSAKLIGWSADKIIPWGYYPPPLEDSRCIRRLEGRHVYTILVTGEMQWYRGHMVVVEAIRRLKRFGTAGRYRVLLTGGGEMFKKVQQRIEGLPIECLGFVTIEKLRQLYEICDIYVAAGEDEPWGMRVNDALNCGAPIVVSDGMGAAKIVRDTGCGLIFRHADAADLALKIEAIASDYMRFAKRAYEAKEKISPKTKANELLSILCSLGGNA